MFFFFAKVARCVDLSQVKQRLNQIKIILCVQKLSMEPCSLRGTAVRTQNLSTVKNRCGKIVRLHLQSYQLGALISPLVCNSIGFFNVHLCLFVLVLHIFHLRLFKSKYLLSYKKRCRSTMA